MSFYIIDITGTDYVNSTITTLLLKATEETEAAEELHAHGMLVTAETADATGSTPHGKDFMGGNINKLKSLK